MKILILGGTGDALKIARSLIDMQHDVTYSIAGIVRQPDLACRVLSGGFRLQQTPQGSIEFDNGAKGLLWHLEQEQYALLIDATHPYASQISENITIAAKQASIPVWRYLRRAWEKTAEDNWVEYASLKEIIWQIKKYKKPFFTIGRGIFSLLSLREQGQQWLVRSVGIESANSPDVIELKDIGPYKLEEELTLFDKHAVDVLISKNSGGEAVAAKLEVARQAKIPVFLLQRPTKPAAARCFSSTQSLIEQIKVNFSG